MALAGHDPAPAEPVRRALPRYAACPLWMFLVFLAFVVARYIQITARLDILASMRFEFLVGGASVTLAIVYLSSHRVDVRGGRNVLIGIVLLFFVMILALPLAADPVVARQVFTNRVFKFALLTFLMVIYLESPKYLRLFQMAFLYSIFYITLESTQGLITGGLYWQNQGVMRLHGAVPIYGHPNSLGGVALGSLPFLWYYWPEFRAWYYRLGILAFATTSIICVIYSGSRTAYVGLIGLVAWFWLNADRKFRFFVRLLVIGAVVVMIIPRQYIERFESIGGHEKEGNSKGMRIEILQDAWTVFKENPLGVGVSSFPAKRLERFGRTQDTHNLYLEVATNLGVQGLAVFGFLIWAIMATFDRSRRTFISLRRRLLTLARRNPGDQARQRAARKIDKEFRFLIATAKGGGGFIFVRLVLGLLGMDLYEIYWWYGAGLAIALAGMATHGRRLVAALEEPPVASA
jgi:putative inorganic carbon (hco3(-)) transporter